ncbi:hypothetical protein [Priestia koreensis]|uniref:Uncharacterized protein n=1 Tax=Priestia koreensis TaxID=284581 RepID=A0A0M0KVP3_9BACI|nr:hypothetical protein [Priestia koreensis]KOO42692.1 hypothetical protein AMD01_16225 [Priestia koreensis]
MNRVLKWLCCFAFVIALSTAGITASQAASKVMWGKLEYKSGMIGKVTVTKDTTRYEKNTKGKLVSVGKMKKGEEWGVYALKPQHYELTRKTYAVKSGSLKYEVLTKSKIDQIKADSRVITSGLKPSTKYEYQFSYPGYGLYTSKFIGRENGYDLWDSYDSRTGNRETWCYFESKSEFVYGIYESDVGSWIKMPLYLNKSWSDYVEMGSDKLMYYRVTSLSKTVTTKAGTFRNAIEIKDSFGNYSYYYPGIGLIKSIGYQNKKMVVYEELYKMTKVR